MVAPRRCCMHTTSMKRLAHVGTLLRTLTVTRAPCGRQALAQPYLVAMDAVPATLRIGIHIRVGDSAVVNAAKKGDKRYRPGYDRPARTRPRVVTMAVTLPILRTRAVTLFQILTLTQSRAQTYPEASPAHRASLSAPRCGHQSLSLTAELRCFRVVSNCYVGFL